LYSVHESLVSIEILEKRSGKQYEKENFKRLLNNLHGPYSSNKIYALLKAFEDEQ